MKDRIIKYLKHDEINLQKWDRCMDHADNGLVYGYSWWLDHLTCHWDGLVLNDYEAVMPLPWKKKLHIHYLYEPFLTAQLGLFGKEITVPLLSDFLHAIPTKFRFWEFSLNYKNLLPVKDFSLSERKNYVLDLEKPYDILQNNYRDSTKRNITRSLKKENTLKKNIDVGQILSIASTVGDGIDKKDATRFLQLFDLLTKQKKAISYGLYALSKELLSSAVFVIHRKRAYYILVGNHPAGKTSGASHALIDAFIQDHAGQELTLDFEGSDIKGLAFFYSSFGAKEENYVVIKENRLPAFIKLIKK